MSDETVKKDRHGELRLMAAAKGYVMVRRPGCMPFVMSGKEWDRMPSPAKWDEIDGMWKRAALSSGKEKADD